MSQDGNSASNHTTDYDAFASELKTLTCLEKMAAIGALFGLGILLGIISIVGLAFKEKS